MVAAKYRLSLLDVENVLPILNRISIPGGLDDQQLYTVFHLLEVEQYNKDDFIFRQGDAPIHIRVIRSGRVRIIEDVEGTPMELCEFNMGDCFGETSVLAIHPHTAAALATEDTELLVIPREACRRLSKTEDIMLHYALEGKPEK